MLETYCRLGIVGLYFWQHNCADLGLEGVELVARVEDSYMPGLVVFLLSAFAKCPVRFEVFAFVFGDNVPCLWAAALVPYFVMLRVVRLVVVKVRCN